MKLINGQKRADFLKKENSKTSQVTAEEIKDFPQSYMVAAFSDGVIKGIDFAESEYEGILLELIESIFAYEKESGSKIIEFDRTPEFVLEGFIVNKKSTK